MIDSADLLSKLPVGSSAMITGTSLARALAIATRCFCPPDNFDTFVLVNFSRFTFLISSNTFGLASFLVNPFKIKTNSIFWYTV